MTTNCSINCCSNRDCNIGSSNKLSIYQLEATTSAFFFLSVISRLYKLYNKRLPCLTFLFNVKVIKIILKKRY